MRHIKIKALIDRRQQGARKIGFVLILHRETGKFIASVPSAAKAERFTGKNSIGGVTLDANA